MYHKILPILLISAALPIKAQTDVDTTAVELHEVVIKAPRVVRKADMDLYYPSASAVDNSKNGIQLIKNLMIPSLVVVESLGTIQASGQTVQVRINGRKSTLEQVQTLNPESIKRVEWIDNPGLRYGGASYVLNVIVVNPDLGGSLMVEGMTCLNQPFSNNYADAKLNFGKSQIEFDIRYKLCNKIESHRRYSETFTYPDATSLIRNEKSLSGALDNTLAEARLSYSYIKPDTTVVMIDLGAQHNFSDRMRYTGLLSLSNGMDDIILTQINGDRGTRPSLSLYWEQHLPARQLLVVSAGASLFLGNTYSDYVESLDAISTPITDIHTKIHDQNQAYAVEADYIKNWKSSRLTAGISYTANRNRSTYENLNDEVFHQRQDRLYFYSEYFHRFGKFTATAGVGGQYTSFRFREHDQGNSSWNVRPQLRIGYTPRVGHRIQIGYSSWQTAPSLSESNIVPQQTDGFQWTVGNPNLKISTTHSFHLQYSFSLPRVTGTLGCSYFFSPNPITPYMFWENDHLVTSYENSDSWRKFRVYLYPQIEVVPQWLMASAGVEYLVERTKGTGYKLHNTDLCYNANIMLTHWGFSLTVMYNRAQKSLWGERISWGENISIAELSYHWNKWQFTLGMLMPFGRYDQGSSQLNHWNNNEQHMGLDMRMPYIKINFNLQWGRQRRSANKLVDVDAEAGTSKAASR